MLRPGVVRIAFPIMACALAACGGSGAADAVVPELGSVSAAVHDSASVLPASRTVEWPADSMSYEGTLSGTAQVHLYSDIDGWVSMGDPASVTFAIFCLQDAMIAASASVPVGTYSQVRLTLRGFVADVAAGAILDGVVVTGPSVIALGGPDAEIIIEKSVTPFSVSVSVPTYVVFDLNTDTWIDATVASAGTIGASEVAAGTQVFVSQ